LPALWAFGHAAEQLARSVESAATGRANDGYSHKLHLVHAIARQRGYQIEHSLIEAMVFIVLLKEGIRKGIKRREEKCRNRKNREFEKKIVAPAPEWR